MSRPTLLERVCSAVDERVQGWEALLRLRDLLKSNPDTTFTRAQLIDRGFDHALVVLDRRRAPGRPHVSLCTWNGQASARADR